MKNFLLAFNIIFPIFAVMAVGYALGRAKVLSDKTVTEANKAVFKVFLPLQLFNNVYSSDLSESLDPKLMITAFAMVLGMFVLSLAVTLLTEKANDRRGVMLQGMFRSNFVIFGVPVATALFGTTGAAKASILIAVVVPTFNVLAVVALTVFGSAQFNPKKIIIGIITNPLIIASAVGILFLLTGLKLPTPVLTAVQDMGKMATPLAFILLGASFKFGEVRSYIKQLTITLSMRLVLLPLLVVTIAILLGFRGAELAILMCMSAAPVAVSSYTMAQQMGGDAKLAGQFVVLSSMLCILTVFLWIFGLKQLAFM